MKNKKSYGAWRLIFQISFYAPFCVEKSNFQNEKFTIIYYLNKNTTKMQSLLTENWSKYLKSKLEKLLFYDTQ